VANVLYDFNIGDSEMMLNTIAESADCSKSNVDVQAEKSVKFNADPVGFHCDVSARATHLPMHSGHDFVGTELAALTLCRSPGRKCTSWSRWFVWRLKSATPTLLV
jgi:hypothetical protein